MHFPWSKRVKYKTVTVLFVAHGSVLVNGGYRTRIISELRALAGYGRRLALLSFEQKEVLEQHGNAIAELERELRACDIGFVYRPIPSFTASAAVKARAARYVAFEIGRVSREWHATVLHAEGHAAAYRAVWAAKASHMKMVLDVHGAHAAEKAYALGDSSSCRRQLSFLIDHAIVHRSDGLIFVSEAMAKYYRPYFHGPATVVPCCVDTTRFRYDPALRAAKRAELGLGERLVVVYNGSLFLPWDEPSDLFKTFRAIRSQQPAAFLLLLSGDAPDRVRALALAEGIDPANFRVQSLPHDKVPEWLVSADVGLLLRRASLVNRVSSPTKVGEYLACGVPIVISDEVGDFSGIVQRENLGICLSENADVFAEDWRLSLANLCSDSMRSRCRMYAERALAWSAMPKHILELYERVLVK
jgi:glycosyltransferase involved in cell wall biosynthesis